MPRSSTPDSSFREEVLNVKLAEMLSHDGIFSVPETILAMKGGKRLPDVIIGDYWGVRVVLEGRIGADAAVEKSLEADCERRIEEGVAAISIGIVYPPALRNSNWNQLEERMRSSPLRIRVFYEASQGDWADSDFNGLSAVLRRAYESLVRDDVVKGAVDELRESIEFAATKLSLAPGGADRIRSFLMMPSEGDSEDVDE